ncbi:hypothetical protein X777_12319 [Ooceraea biroi]|uniref:Uncharacterized protein n=1 Tax=Ooceraea biroi TaxID=2015173 RepID=A0A026W2N5_OOCBI|nr:hypothetical protein X777_12319 [Ooceraea biroi]
MKLEFSQWWLKIRTLVRDKLNENLVLIGGAYSASCIINKFHPYHLSLHQALHGMDFVNRVEFCQWAQQQIRINDSSFDTVLFTDEATFTNHGNVNLHNMHFWAVENPHWLRQIEHQRQWSLNV